MPLPCRRLDLDVVGQIPAAFEGRYLRNGPNPIGSPDPSTSHWFLGSGMVHGVRLRGGRAEWYRNRWVRGGDVTAALGERAPTGTGRVADFSPNTSVGGFAGTTWAMVEAGTPPYELTYELDTVGCNAFYDTLPNGFTAHPKIDPVAGELHAMCYSWSELFDHVQYVVVGSDGRVRRTVDIALSGMPMIHDMSLTENYAVIYDLPVTVDLDIALGGVYDFPFRWNPDHGARIGLMPREGTAADITWIDVGLCYVFHPLNAFEDEAGRVVLDVCRYELIFDKDVLGPFGDSLPTLDRWIVDPGSRRVSEERIDDRFHEFPQIRHSLTGGRHRYGYTVGLSTDLTYGSTYKTDFETGLVTEHDHGPGRGSEEAGFVADPDRSGEDDGWLVSYVTDRNTDTSELVILDATDLRRDPVARVRLPQRVPHGFHGSWVPDRSVPPPPSS